MSVLDSLLDLLDNGMGKTMVLPIVEALFEGDDFEDDNDKKCLVLLHHLAEQGEIDTDISTVSSTLVRVGKAEYLVLNEAEREERWDDTLEYYLDECEVPGADGPYFDREAWKRDARMDGAGPALATYDMHEHEINVAGNWFWIYRVN